MTERIEVETAFKRQTIHILKSCKLRSCLKKAGCYFPPLSVQNWTSHNLGQKCFRYFLPRGKHFTSKAFLKKNPKTNTQNAKQHKSKPFTFQMLIKKLAPNPQIKILLGLSSETECTNVCLSHHVWNRQKEGGKSNWTPSPHQALKLNSKDSLWGQLKSQHGSQSLRLWSSTA